MDPEAKPFLVSGSSDTLDQEDTDSSIPHKPRSQRHKLKLLVKYFLIFALSLLLGFFLGHNYKAIFSSSKSKYGGLLRTPHQDILIHFNLILTSVAPAGNTIRYWQHNLTFSQAPTSESEAAWNSMVPLGRGFIHQPTIAPFISNIAAFHELHCLVQYLFLLLSLPPDSIQNREERN